VAVTYDGQKWKRVDCEGWCWRPGDLIEEPTSLDARRRACARLDSQSTTTGRWHRRRVPAPCG